MPSKRRKGYRLGYDFKTQFELKLMLFPAVVLIFVFNFTPLFGLLMAFKSYEPAMGIKGIFTSDWNHFQHFTRVFHNFQFWPMVRNTLGINLLSGLIGIPVTLFLP